MTNQAFSTGEKTVVWLMAAVMLFILNDFYPKLAKGALALIIVGVLLYHSSDYVKLVTNATTQVSNTSTKQGN